MLAKMPAPVKGLSSLVEPLYAPGHVLMDDDLTAGIVFTRSLSRLLLRSLFGCGVICGYGVLPKVECERLKITIQPGVALDCHGDPVEMKSSETLTIGDACGEQLPPRLWVMIRRAQHACAPRELACPSDDEDDACGCHATRARAGYELKVVDRRPCGACGCAPPEQAPAPPGEFQPQPGAAQPASMIRATNTGYGINVVERRILDVRDRVTKLNENHASWTAEAMSAR
ncbi:MAG: hypothetical protein JWQ29_988, partial [Phenylobacterium sp.]|nr:hypothetical protein [Phenylobacterium sp.]